MKRDTATIDELKVRANRLYQYCVLTGFGAVALIAVAAARHLLEQPSATSMSMALAASLIPVGIYLAYRRTNLPIERYEARQTALRRSFKEVRYSCSDQIEELFQGTAAARADKLITESLSKVRDTRDGLNERWERAYEGMSWWGKLTNDPPDLSAMDKKIAELEKAKQRLAATGEVQKARAIFDAMEERSQRRIDASEHAALRSVPHSHLEPYDGKAIAKSALLFSAMSVPVSAWGDLSQASSIYDTLREVNGNYEGMSDFEIWLKTLIMPGESLAGLVSLTKGAYFETLVEADLGGERFEHFNHPDTDIVVDGVAYQVKATDSTSYVESVADGIPVIATTEVAHITGVLDGGYTDEELASSVELALGGSVIDGQDTAVDALLTGVGGLGILATIKGINHAFAKHQEGGDGFDAMLEGAGVAVAGTAKGLIDTAELGYKALRSTPSRFVGRSLGKVAGAVGRRLFGSYTINSIMLGIVVSALLVAPPAVSQGLGGAVEVKGAEIRIEGSIDQAVADSFIQQMKSHPGLERVSLNSPGGLVSPALEVARAINAAGLKTSVPNGDECHSACSLIFLAGRERIADGLLGVHQISGVNDPSLTQAVISQIYEELVTFNTPSHLVSRMLRTPPDDMYVFTPEELERHSINIRDADKAGAIPHLLALETWTRQDWLVGVFMNTNINRPFIALESREMSPLLRIAHYPHRSHTFVEIMLPEQRLSGATSRVELRFGHGNDKPYSLFVDADIETNSYAFDLPNNPEETRMFWAAFTTGTHLTVLNGYGIEIGRFSLKGSRRAVEDFTTIANR
ncbi:MAG TPA: hypothetical protein VNS02_12865 [Rhizobiaceae bacterium]|nr:hypothetical protein [Rhizobiaceae bacterium]